MSDDTTQIDREYERRIQIQIEKIHREKDQTQQSRKNRIWIIWGIPATWIIASVVMPSATTVPLGTAISKIIAPITSIFLNYETFNATIPAIQTASSVTALVLPVIILGVLTNLWGLREMYRDHTLQCPHCGEHVNIDRPWSCGWCLHSHKKTKPFSMVETGKSVIDSCQNEACRKLASAFYCTKCGDPIVFNVEAYNTKTEIGAYTREGVGTFLK